MVDNYIDIDEISSDHIKDMARLHATYFHPPWSASQFNNLLVLPAVSGLIANMKDSRSQYLDFSHKYLGNKCLGFILFSIAGDECEILTIIVLSFCRRQGVATNLIKNTVIWAKKFAVRKIFLEVAENNAPARKFYEKQGFKEIGLRKKYYKAPEGHEDAILFRKSLH